MKPDAPIVVYDATVRSGGSVSVMYKQLKRSAVTVALITACAAVPAMAAPPPVSGSNSAVAGPGRSATGLSWSATNYTGDGSATVYRRVVVSGYHPAEGFETETVREQAQLVRTETAGAAAGGPTQLAMRSSDRSDAVAR